MAKENQISIYKVDDKNIFFSECTTRDEMIEKIISRGNGSNAIKRRKKNNHLEISDYNLKEIRDIDNSIFSIKLYHGERKNPNSWNDFLADVIVNNENSARFWNQNHDFIVFVYNDKDFFCFTGGIGCNLVNDICDENFPKELMIRLADSEKIRQAKSRGLTGAFYARELYFRGNYNISPSESFGSIWKDVRASIREEVAKDSEWEAIIGDSSTRDINCDVKNSFKIRKKVSFKNAIKLIEKINNEYNRELTPKEKENFYFLNTVRIVKNKDEKDRLNDELTKKAYYFLTDRDTDFDYEFCHKNYTDFFEADSIIAKRDKNELMRWNDTINAKIILDDLRDKFNLLDFKLFKEDFTKKIKIKTEQCDEKYRETEGSILDHLNGELALDKNGAKDTFFLIDKEWCFVQNEFLKILNDEFSAYVSSDVFCDKRFLKSWAVGDSEGVYNESHLGMDKFLVADRITINGIEVFDLLFMENEVLYIIQVKDGLGASTRDACSQLRNSAKLIENSLKERNHTKIKEFYKKLKNNNVQYAKKSEFVNILNEIGDENKFVEIFSNVKKRVYVLAFRYGGSLDEIMKTKSNIARFEILSLKDDIKVIGEADFKLYQIK